jgi:hypothetical protein
MDDRQARVGRNEVLFREINERLEALQERFDTLGDSLDFVCECGKLGCTEQITMPLDEYRQLRAEPTHFAIKPGHEIPDVEDVVGSRRGYDIVRKHEGEAADLARAENPRGDG